MSRVVTFSIFSIFILIFLEKSIFTLNFSFLIKIGIKTTLIVAIKFYISFMTKLG